MGDSYMADATGQPLDKIEEDTDRDFFMTPEEAQEYGIIDEVSIPLSLHFILLVCLTFPLPLSPVWFCIRLLSFGIGS